MKNYALIKIYRPEYSIPDCQDISCDRWNEYCDEIKEYFKKFDTEIFMTAQISHIDATEAFVEVEHSADLSREQKTELIELLKPLFTDWRRKCNGMEEYSVLKMVKFHKTSDEIFVLDTYGKKL